MVGRERVAAEPAPPRAVLSAAPACRWRIRIARPGCSTGGGGTCQALADRFPTSGGQAGRASATGNLAVRASSEVSFASLPAAAPGGPDPAQVFRLLGLWHGPSTQPGGRVQPCPVNHGGRWPAALTRSLTRTCSKPPEPDRYRFHDLLRAYAAEGAAHPGDRAGPHRRRPSACSPGTCTPRRRRPGSSHRSADRFRSTRSPPPPLHPLGFGELDAALAWCEDERPQLMAATRLAAASGLNELAWRLPAPLFQMFSSRGNWADCIATSRIALESARQAGSRQGEAWILNNLGDALGFTRHSEGIDCLERSLAIRREVGDRMGEAHAANNLAVSTASPGGLRRDRLR